MKRKTYGAGGSKIVKTSISLPDVLMEFAERRCKEEGFNSFSSYVAHLVRIDKEKHADEVSSSPTAKPEGSAGTGDPVTEIAKRSYPLPGTPRRK